MKATDWLLITVAAASLTGCGKFNEKFGRIDKHGMTNVSVGAHGEHPSGTLFENATLNGGVLVYMVADDGHRQSVFLNDETQVFSLPLPNGKYTFYAYGWETANLQSNNPRCGVANGVSLNGADLTVNLPLSKASCSANSSFAPSNAYDSGSPPTLLPLSITMCGHGVSFTGVNASGGCTAGESSSWFFRGQAGGAVGEGAYLASLDTLVFVAPIGSTIPELYATKLPSGVQERLSPTSMSGSVGVQQMQAVPNTSTVVYTANLNGGSALRLYRFDLASGTNTLLSQSSPVSGTHGVQWMRLAYTSGGTYAVYVADMQTVGLYELYSVNLSATTPSPVKISGTMNGSNGILNCVNSGNFPTCPAASSNGEAWRFALSTDLKPSDSRRSANTANPYVLYVADQNLGTSSAANTYSLFVASLDGSPLFGTIPSGTQVSASEVSTSYDYVDDLRFSFDASYFVYHVHLASGYNGYFAQPFTSAALGSPAPRVLCALSSTCGAKRPYFAMARTHESLVYQTTNSSYPAINYADLTTATNNTSIYVSTGTETSFVQFDFTPTDLKVVSLTQDSSLNYRVLRSAPATTSATPVVILETVPTGSSIRSMEPSGNKYFLFTSDSQKVVYMADRNTASAVELFYATVGTASSGVAVSGTGIAAANSVVSAGLLSDVPYFAAAIATAGAPELYSTNLAASATPVQLGSSTVAGHVVSISDYSPFPTKIIYTANPLVGGSASEIYSYDVVSGAHRRLTTVYGGASGAGRIQVTALQYPFSQPGDLNFGAAVQSQCLPPPAVDGASLATGFRVPLGTGGSEPFAFAVDVYPQATSCSGPSLRYLFPNGFANSNSLSLSGGLGLFSVSAPNAAILKAQSSYLNLFLREL